MKYNRTTEKNKSVRRIRNYEYNETHVLNHPVWRYRESLFHMSASLRASLFHLNGMKLFFLYHYAFILNGQEKNSNNILLYFFFLLLAKIPTQ